MGSFKLWRASNFWRGGRIQHYSAGLPYVLPFVALFPSIIGTDQEPVNEATVSLPSTVSEAAVYPLWPPVPSSLYDAFLGGHTGDSRLVIITWDSSVHCWGMVLRWWANPDGKVIVG